MSPEDLFLAWLIALPDRVDASVAARGMLDDLRRIETPSPAQARFAELLRQVTPFALAQRKRGDRARRGRVFAAAEHSRAVSV